MSQMGNSTDRYRKENKLLLKTYNYIFLTNFWGFSNPKKVSVNDQTSWEDLCPLEFTQGGKSHMSVQFLSNFCSFPSQLKAVVMTGT